MAVPSGGARAAIVAAHQMREIGHEGSLGHSARAGVAVHARFGFKDVPASGNGSILCFWLLVFHPCVELVRRVDIHPNQHFGVFEAAELRALADIEAGGLRIDPHLNGMVGNEIGFAAKLRHPEAMVETGATTEQTRARRESRVRIEK